MMNGIEFSEYRERYDLTTYGMADVLGVAQSTIVNWELGKSRIPFLAAQAVRDPEFMRKLIEQARARAA